MSGNSKVNKIKSLIEKIKKIKIGDSFESDGLKFDSPGLVDYDFGADKTNINLEDYSFYKLNNELKKLIDSTDIKLPEGSIIEIPNVNKVDFVVSIKQIYDCNKSKNIRDLALEIKDLIEKSSIEYIDKVKLQGIFINIYVGDNYVYDVREMVLENIGDYGKNRSQELSNLIIDYSSPNMAKNMTVGHLRSTIIGETVARLNEFSGGGVLRWNYLGDWGTPFGKVLYSLIHHYNKEGEKLLKELDNNPVYTLERLYVSFGKLQKDDKLEKAKFYFKLLEKGHGDVYKLWEIIRDYTLIDFEEIYEKMSVNFDVKLGEAFMHTKSNIIFEDLKENEFLIKENGAWIVKFISMDKYKGNKKILGDFAYVPLKENEIDRYDKDDIKVAMIQKSDGAGVYLLRDLTAIKYRIEYFDADKIYYEVGMPQSMHFEMLFALAERLGYAKYSNLKHISHGLYKMDGDKMSSRKGNVYRLGELIDEVKKHILDKYSERINKSQAIDLAISAININDLKNDRQKDVNFDINEMTKLKGDSGIYLQYTSVRIDSLMDKIETLEYFEKNHLQYLNDQEREIIKDISLFPYYIYKSSTILKPHLLVQYILKLARSINSWYDNVDKIIDMDEEAQQAKYYFLKAIRETFDQAFHVVNLSKVTKM